MTKTHVESVLKQIEETTKDFKESFKIAQSMPAMYMKVGVLTAHLQKLVKQLEDTVRAYTLNQDRHENPQN